MLCPPSITCASTQRPAAYELWKQLDGNVSSSRDLYCSYPEGRETLRLAGGAIDQVRFRHQSADCPGARPRRAANLARDRRRGDRIKALFAALHMSPYGSAPRRRESSVEEESTRRVVD